MIIRNYLPSDFDKIRDIHSRYYKDEFDFEDFNDKFLQHVFIAADENDKIITAGGLKPILESIIITDKSFSPRQRREALLNLLQANLFASRKMGYDQIHAFIQDEHWSKILKQYGFKDCVGKALVLKDK